MTTMHPTTRANLGNFFSEGARVVWMRVIMKGVSQEEIRRAIGLGRGMVHRFLYGDRRMSLDVAVRFERAYGIQPKLWLDPPRKPFALPTLVAMKPSVRRQRKAA